MLMTAELVIDKSITISGPGANLLAVSRSDNAPDFRIFHVIAGLTVVAQDLTISNGLAPGFENGGGTLIHALLLWSTNCTVSDKSTTTPRCVNRPSAGNQPLGIESR